MADDLAMRCKCGEVRGRAVDVTPGTTSHVVCYCQDCRAFMRWLDRMPELDAAGGTTIVQMARGRLVIDEGFDEVRCLRLTRKGLYRFYTACCKTPIGNSIPKLPFFGVISPFFGESAFRLHVGAPTRVQTSVTLGPVPPHPKVPVKMFLHVGRLLIGWRLKNLFGDQLFDENRRAKVPIRVLTTEERAAIRD